MPEELTIALSLLSRRALCRRARLFAAPALLLALWFSQARAAQAHGTHLASAKVVKRERHLTIELRVDLVAYVARHAPARPGTKTPLPEMLGALPAWTIPPMIEEAEKALRDAMHVKLDGEAVAMQRMTFPSAEAVQRLASARLETGAAHDGSDDPPIVIEALLPRETGELAINFDGTMGPLIVSFSQPSVRLLAAGETWAQAIGGARPQASAAPRITAPVTSTSAPSSPRSATGGASRFELGVIAAIAVAFVFGVIAGARFARRRTS